MKEGFDHRVYRSNLAKDLSDIHKNDPKDARSVLDIVRTTTNYDQAQKSHEADQKRRYLDQLGSMIKLIQSFENYNLNMTITSNKKRPASELIDKTKDQQYITGLSIEPVKTDQKMILVNDKGISEDSPTEIRINIADVKKVNQALNSFNTDSLTGEDVSSLRYIAESLTKQIQKEYDLNTAEDDRLLNLFLGLEELIQNYKRLDSVKDESSYTNGLAQSVAQLEKYLEISRAGYMKEYIMAETNRLLPAKLGNWTDWDGRGGRKKMNDDTPSTWQEDIQILPNRAPFLNEEGDANGRYRYLDSFRNKWSRAFETLDAMKNNPKATEFYTEIKEYLTKCLEYVEKNGSGMTDSWKDIEKKYPTLAAEMSKIKLELEKH